MHTHDCAAVQDRRTFIRNLQDATVYRQRTRLRLVGITGTEEEMRQAWGVLHGIYQEYHDDGDQMVENCDCGEAAGR